MPDDYNKFRDGDHLDFEEKVADLDRQMNERKFRVAGSFGFELQRARLNLYGLCRECREAGPEAE